jgi:hypothetical protein
VESYLRVSWWLLGAVLAAGCGGLPGKADSQRIAEIRRVAVVPLVGEELELTRVGVTVFGNKRAYFPIPAWGMNDVIFDAVQATLSAGKRLAVSRLDSAHGPFHKMYTTIPARPFDLENVAAELRELAARCECDALLLVSRTQHEDALGGTNQYVYGIGWYARTVNDRASVSYAFTAYHVILLDAKTLAPLASAQSRLREAAEAVPAATWPQAMSSLDASHRELLRPILERLVRASMPETLKRAGLAP